MVLLLAWHAHGHGLDALVVASNAAPVKYTRYEPAGFSFHAAALRLLGLLNDRGSSTSSTSGGSSSSDDDEDGALKKQKRTSSASSFTDSSAYGAGSGAGGKKKKKGAGSGELQDHYALLGLGHLRFLATEEQVRKAYREVALRHHPDKQAAVVLQEETEEARENKKNEIDSHFKAIQEAYEVLLDPVKRRVYDSVDEFDDEIPDGNECSAEEFYKVFGPVFARNARWSVVQPAPGLGDDDSPMDEVDVFYDFWYAFKSWREFPHADEFELDQAEGREHKRWMERQNAKLRERARKDELARIRTLVDSAYKRDPRVSRRREQDKAEKLRKKQAKVAAKREKEDQAARAAEEERLRKEQEERRLAEETAALKKNREKEKKLIRKERSRLRALASSGATLKSDDVESLCSSLDLAQLKSLCDSLEGKPANERAQLLWTALGREQEELPPPPPPPPASAEEKKPEPTTTANKGSEGGEQRAWHREEVELLRKAVAKYPKGTSQRWEMVADYIGTGRSVEEILRAVKTVLLQKPDSSKAFDTFLEKRKPPKSIDSPLSTREAEAAASSNGGAAEAPAPAPAAEANGSEDAAEDEWSDAQKLALIKAVKTFPKETNARWERIAAAVPGKNKTQCFKKFTALRDDFKSKK